MLQDGRLLGNALFDDDASDYAQFRPVLIDLDAGTMHQIRGLPAGLASLDAAGGPGGYTFPRDVVYGIPRRVTAGDGDCLNVRDAPAAAANTFGCYVDGVLFLQRGAAEGDWLPVTDPQGNEGWAAAEFLE